ncbi:NAD-dependent epimerase/dehydratase family protein [Thermodesulfobacteriota bacterium]
MVKKIFLITGGAGFVGSHIAIRLKECNENTEVIALDNLKRRGSELNLPRLKDHGVHFLHGDIRNREDLESINQVDCIIECSAEPSVLAGYQDSAGYVLNTNLFGTVNCLELAKKYGSDFIFLSTSRIYPIEAINSIRCRETDKRYLINAQQELPGVTEKGISETFPLHGTRSLYGATKLCSEFIIREYIDMYGIRGVTNRCGLLTGPWQMGKIDQGVIALWVAKHIFEGELNYIGFGGEGKQVRDMLHVEDLFSLLSSQLKNLNEINGQTFNVGGGIGNSLSLIELTELCRKYTGSSIRIGRVEDNRQGDIKIYVTDNGLVSETLGWQPAIGCEQIIEEISNWIKDNEELLRPIFS